MALALNKLSGWGGRGEPVYCLGPAGNFEILTKLVAFVPPFPWADINLPLVSLVGLLSSVSPSYKHVHSFT